MKIFISWSKEKSSELAHSIDDFLKGMFRDKIASWISDENIVSGTRPMTEIKKALTTCDKGIFCLTKNNYESPWIMYEAGAMSMHESANNENAILTILFDNLKIEKVKDGPLGQYQLRIYSYENIKTFAKEINDILQTFDSDELFKKQFDLNWNVLNEKVKQILHRYEIGGENILDKKTLMQELSARQFSEPITGEITEYPDGFETQKLLLILLPICNNRLWIYGRKNRKLFSNENELFFNSINQKDNFDLRCLFLSPNAPSEIVNTAQQKNNFVLSLKYCIKEADDILSRNGIDIANVCRMYDNIRSDEIIIADDVVLFSHILFDENDMPEHMTNTSFKLVESKDPIGSKLLKEFEDIWQTAIPIKKQRTCK